MAKVFETTVDGYNYDVVWSDTLRGPVIDAVLFHNTETPANVALPTMEKIQNALAADIVVRALKM